MGKSEPKSDTKRKFIRCEVSPEQHEAIRKLAQADQRSIAVWAQRVIVAAIPADARPEGGAPHATVTSLPNAPQRLSPARLVVDGEDICGVMVDGNGITMFKESPGSIDKIKAAGLDPKEVVRQAKLVPAEDGVVRVTVV